MENSYAFAIFVSSRPPLYFTSSTKLRSKSFKHLKFEKVPAEATSSGSEFHIFYNMINKRELLSIDFAHV